VILYSNFFYAKHAFRAGQASLCFDIFIGIIQAFNMSELILVLKRVKANRYRSNEDEGVDRAPGDYLTLL
jgi:hypothetical protein